MSNPLIIYSPTLKHGELWWKCNEVSSHIRPIFVYPKNAGALRGQRDRVIIVIGRPPWPEELEDCKGRNTILSIDGD